MSKSHKCAGNNASKDRRVRNPIKQLSYCHLKRIFEKQRISQNSSEAPVGHAPGLIGGIALEGSRLFILGFLFYLIALIFPLWMQAAVLGLARGFNGGEAVLGPNYINGSFIDNLRMVVPPPTGSEFGNLIAFAGAFMALIIAVAFSVRNNIDLKSLANESYVNNRDFVKSFRLAVDAMGIAINFYFISVAVSQAAHRWGRPEQPLFSTEFWTLLGVLFVVSVAANAIRKGYFGALGQLEDERAYKEMLCQSFKLVGKTPRANVKLSIVFGVVPILACLILIWLGGPDAGLTPLLMIVMFVAVVCILETQVPYWDQRDQKTMNLVMICFNLLIGVLLSLATITLLATFAIRIMQDSANKWWITLPIVCISIILWVVTFFGLRWGSRIIRMSIAGDRTHKHLSRLYIKREIKLVGNRMCKIEKSLMGSE